jgi:hypothetical protein
LGIAGGVREWMAKTGSALVLMIDQLPPPGCIGGDFKDSAMAQGAATLLGFRHIVDAAMGLPSTQHVYGDPWLICGRNGVLGDAIESHAVLLG